MTDNYRRIARDGIWDNNIIFTQSLALCPLLAVSSTASNGLGMGLATTSVMVASGMLIAMLREIITPQVRIPVFILIIAALVTLVDLWMNAWLHDLHKVLGLFIPLIVTNCAILGRAEAFASRNPVLPAMFDGLMMGLGFTMALMIMGLVRELLGSGTLFANAALLLGQWASVLELKVIADYKGFLLIILPPGGFLVLGFLLAGKRLIDDAIDKKSPLEELPTSIEQSAAAAATS